jgi:hypothetical protein
MAVLFCNLTTGLDVRTACRSGFENTTSGIASTYLQANLMILPSRSAADFRGLCARNPVPCPLLAESKTIGSYDNFDFMAGLSETADYNPLNVDLGYEMDGNEMGLFDPDYFLDDEFQWDEEIIAS